jgi:hypothetical protein
MCSQKGYRLIFQASIFIPDRVVLKMLLVKGTCFFLFIVIRYVAIDLLVYQKPDISAFKVGRIKTPGNNAFRQLSQVLFCLENLRLQLPSIDGSALRHSPG